MTTLPDWAVSYVFAVGLASSGTTFFLLALAFSTLASRFLRWRRERVEFTACSPIDVERGTRIRLSGVRVCEYEIVEVVSRSKVRLRRTTRQWLADLLRWRRS